MSHLKEVSPANRDFWKEIRRLRRAAEMSQRALADTGIFGHEQETISRKEKYGGRLPKRSQVLRFAKRLRLGFVQRETLLGTAGFIWTPEVHEGLLDRLRSEQDKERLVGNFTVGQLEEIVSRCLEVVKLHPNHKTSFRGPTPNR